MARITKQVLEQRELLGSEFDGFASSVHGVALHVELEVGEGQSTAPGLVQAAPCDRPNASQELGERERLWQVIVRPEVQPLHSVRHLTPRRKKERGCLDPGVAQLTEQIESVPLRQHHVEQQKVVGPAYRSLKTRLAIRGDVDDKAVLSQTFVNVFARNRVILDVQNLHARKVPKTGEGAMNRIRVLPYPFARSHAALADPTLEDPCRPCPTPCIPSSFTSPLSSRHCCPGLRSASRLPRRAVGFLGTRGPGWFSPPPWSRVRDGWRKRRGKTR